MKRTLICLCILSALVFGCKKEYGPQTVSGVKLRLDDDSLLAAIEQFYNSIYNGGDNVIVPVGESEFLIEATYNYYCARNELNGSSSFFSFSVTAPLSEGGIRRDDLSTAFYKIKDSLLERYDEISYLSKRLGLFDISAEITGEDVLYTVKATIIDGPAIEDNVDEGQTGEIVFNDNAIHAWSAYGNTGVALWGGYQPGSGQCDIVSNAATNINGNVGSAPQSLRYYGVVNFNPNTTFNLVINLVTNMVTPANIATSPSPYSSLLGFDLYNYDVFKGWEFTSNVCNSVDGLAVYKSWITNDQMNFYLSAIPGYIGNNIPAGKHFHDFNIAYVSCLCCFAPNTINNPYNFGDYAAMKEHYYYITSSDWTNITLESDTPLENM